jgi:hypothetical protein
MKFILARLATAAILAITAAAQDGFTINTPSNVVVCQPILLSWTGGTPPYFLTIHDGNNPTGPAIQDLGSQDSTSFTWTVNIAAGTSIGLAVRDSTGQSVQSASFPINSGSSTDCIDNPPTTTASGTDTAATSAATPPATTRPTTAAASSTKPATSSTGASSAQTSNAASYPMAPFGAGGIIGAALIALLA